MKKIVYGVMGLLMIYGGAMLLVAATIWNIVARTRRSKDASRPRRLEVQDHAR